MTAKNVVRFLVVFLCTFILWRITIFLPCFNCPCYGSKRELIIFWINCLHLLKRNRQLKDKVRNVRTFLRRRDFSTKWYTIFDAIYGLEKTILSV